METNLELLISYIKDLDYNAVTQICKDFGIIESDKIKSNWNYPDIDGYPPKGTYINYVGFDNNVRTMYYFGSNMDKRLIKTWAYLPEYTE